MESDRRGRFDENSPRYGSAALRSSFVKRPSNLRAHISEDSDDQEDDSGSLRIRMGHGHQNKGQPDLRSPSLSAMSSPQRPAYRSVTHDSPVSGFDGMARELRREFERITNAQQHNPSSAQSSPAASHRTSYPTATGLKSPNANLGRRVFADVSNQRDSSPSYSNDGLKQPQSHQRQASFKSPRSKSNPQPLRVHQDDHVFRSSPRHPGTDYVMPDVTGLTEGLTSPEKGRAYRKLATPDKRSQGAFPLWMP